MDSLLHVRLAETADLDAIWAIRYANDVAGEEAPPPAGAVPAYLSHVRRTGELLVAERESQIVGYAGRVTRGRVSFLTDLFIRPDCQSSAVGSMLLRAVLPADRGPRCTLASTDHRALALYARAGMAPRWPVMLMWLTSDQLGPLPPTGLDLTEVEPSDQEMIDLDAEISGRSRAVDLAYWSTEEGAISLAFRRGGEMVGYGLVRLGGGRLWTAGAAAVGPIGARRAGDAAACVVAAVAWARTRAPVVEIAVPGPHPALAALLAARFRLVYVETFCATRATLVDPRRYVGSGGDLF